MTWNSNVFCLYNDDCSERDQIFVKKAEDFLGKQTNPSAKDMNKGKIKFFIVEILMIVQTIFQFIYHRRKFEPFFYF